jgi:putative oxygen-independent coproporphyrinogen III oxidase
LTSQPVPLSLYIHFPWCVKKCPYCDFNSFEPGSSNLESEYIETLKADLVIERERLGPSVSLHSIFMGGGTPSLFSTAAIASILETADSLFPINQETEITLEANPGTTDQEKFNGYFQAGVNRISIGVQSFDNNFLKELGRIHTANDAQKAFTAAREAGFTNINLDLMHGLPGQTLGAALNDLKIAVSLQSEHLSWYQLTIEPNTYFHKFPPILPDEDHLWEIYETGLTYLASEGFTRYEISAFSKQERQCRHNLNYWSFGDYLGIGAGAHGKITTPGNPFSIARTTKTRSPTDYLKNANRKEALIEPDSMVLEFMMNTLRTTEGFTRTQFEQRTGLKFESIEGFVQTGIDRKLLEKTEARVKPTDFGLRYLDELLMLVE